MTQTLLLAHAVSTLALFGLIWFVQIVHYPLFELAERTSFRTFSTSHQVRTSAVVVPLMITEAVTTTMLAASPPDGASILARTGLLLLAFVWLSTFLFQVPRHRRLLAGYSRAAIRLLVRTNWIRTAAWTGRAAIAVALIARELPA